MKSLKKILAFVIAMVMILALGVTAFADETTVHTITIKNTDQNVSHSYEAYQVFKGTLDATQTKLTGIDWGNGVNKTALLNALKASTDPALMSGDPAANVFSDCATAADVAEVLGGFASTTGLTASAGAIDAVAGIIASNLGAKAADFNANGTTYTASVTGDGYYFIKDTTTALSVTDESATNYKASDTLSKHLLAVVRDTEIVAKDTGFTPDKEIVAGSARVKAGSAAVGDVVTFEVTIPVPNTKKYVDHFVFDMRDKLPYGMTFMGVTSVKVDTADVPYTLTVAPKDSTTYAAYTAPADAATAVTTTGGQQIKLVFNNFKENAESGNWIGQYMVITYTAVVNKDADFTPTGNINEVEFDYSNDPNHDYDGDEPDTDEPMGTTPKDQTKTVLINLVINKTGDNGTVKKLEGAEFEITSNDYTVTLVSGEKFEASDYELEPGETAATGTYYKLKDGTYTDKPSTEATASAYESTTVTYKKIILNKSIITPGTNKKVTAVTDSNGTIKLEGLDAGTYTIKETKAPNGYNADPNTYTIKVDWDSTTKAFELDSSNSSTGVAFDTTTATASVTIDNKSGSTLPETGGIGTTIFYIIGAILVLGAGILLVTRRRMSVK